MSFKRCSALFSGAEPRSSCSFFQLSNLSAGTRIRKPSSVSTKYSCCPFCSFIRNTSQIVFKGPTHARRRGYIPERFGRGLARNRRGGHLVRHSARRKRRRVCSERRALRRGHVSRRLCGLLRRRKRARDAADSFAFGLAAPLPALLCALPAALEEGLRHVVLSVYVRHDGGISAQVGVILARELAIPGLHFLKRVAALEIVYTIFADKSIHI